MRKSIKNLTLAAVALGAFSLTACMSSGSKVSGVNDDENATVFVSAKMKNVNTLSKPGLGKLTPITLTTLRITAVSDKVGEKVLGEDSVVVEYEVGDTIAFSPDTVIFSDTATADLEFSLEMSLRPLRSWTLTVETIDDEDDVIQSGSANLGQLFAGQVKGVSVNAGALFHNYKAKFNFADSITSTTGTISRQDLKVTSIWMKIGTDTVFGAVGGGDTVIFISSIDTVETQPEVVLDTIMDTVLLVKPNFDHFLNIYKVDTLMAVPSSTDSVYLNIYGYLPQGPANGGSVKPR